MEGLDIDDVFQHCRLNPTEMDAVTYYLPRLLSGETLHGVEKFIHSVEISGCEPKDLAARYAPVPQAVSSGDRFFFTTCKSKNGSKLEASPPAALDHRRPRRSATGGKVGEVKNLSFKKKASPPGHGGVRCRSRPPSPRGEGSGMHLAQDAPAAAKNRHRHASRTAARPHRESTHARRGRAPPPILIPTPQQEDARCHTILHRCTGFLADESIHVDDGDMGGFSCSMEELLPQVTKLCGGSSRTSLGSRSKRTSSSLTTQQTRSCGSYR
ncbi:hypothetical protein ZWY2020_050282 [Hordeum vulgare]|nr:hypothetical protein ZWY2020_050282 [Hordeum vulgare]